MNAGLVRAGYAWIYQKYATDRSLYRVEAEAKAAQRRLWALPETQKAPPWEWRHGGKQPAQAAPAQRRGRLRLKAILPRDGVV